MTEDNALPLMSHLLELRTRLLRCILCIIIVFLGLIYSLLQLN